MTASIPADGPGPAVGQTEPPTKGADPERRDQPWSWHASRATALLLVVLMPLHFAVTFIVDDLGATTARSMSARLDDPTWRMLTWLTVALALVHATLSANSALRRRLPGTSGTVLVALIGLGCGALLAAATWVLTTRWV